MANDAKKTSELGITTTLSANDRIVVLTNPSSTPATQTIPLPYLANSIVNVTRYANSSAAGVVKIDNSTILISNTGILSTKSLTGPFANDAAASSGGVSIGSLYYDSTGAVKIRLT